MKNEWRVEGGEEKRRWKEEEGGQERRREKGRGKEKTITGGRRENGGRCEA